MSSGNGTRTRWRIVQLLNRLPGQCWADLVMWALRSWNEDEGRWPWRPISRYCRDDMAEVGYCYCGKLRRDDDTADVVPS